MKHLFSVLLPVFVLLFSHSVLGSTSSESVDAVTNATASTPALSHTEEVIQRWREIESFVKKTSAMLVKSLLPQAVRAFQELELSTNCSRSLMKLMSGIKQTKSWAYRMIDSSGKIPDGIYYGSSTTIGDYDVCIGTEVPGNFRGQYCSVDFQVPLPERERFVPGTKIIQELINFTLADTVVSDFVKKGRYYYRVKFRSAVCIPSSCSRMELEKIVGKVVDELGLKVNMSVTNCETKVDRVVFDSSQIVIIAVLSSLLLTAVVATIADVVLKVRSKEKSYQKDLGVPMKCLLCFSFYTNIQRLLKKDDSPDSIKIFHGMKVVTILWVILNHTYAYLNYQVMQAPMEHMNRHGELEFQFVLNGYLNVETFFFISAVLLSYGWMKSKEERLNVPLVVVRRIWRLAPPFMLVIACVFLIPHLGSGPVWKEMVVDELTEKCRESWWKNLLFINNLFSKENMCMHWMWYIPADTHLYFMSLLVIIPMKRNPKLAFTINALLFVLLTTITAVIHIVNRIAPTAVINFVMAEDFDHYIDIHYFRSWVHCSTYTIGLTVGYLMAKKQKVHIPLKYNILGWVASVFLAVTVVYGVYDWNQGNLPGTFVSTLYACTNKLVFSLALCWVTFTCVTGNAGVVSSILSWGAFVPLGRLTYMAYLIHPIIQHMYVGSYRTFFRPDHRTMVFSYLAYVVLSFMCATFLSMLFESPFLSLEKIALSRRRRPLNPNAKNKEVELGDQKHNGILHLNADNGIYTINVKQIENDR